MPSMRGTIALEELKGRTKRNSPPAFRENSSRKGLVMTLKLTGIHLKIIIKNCVELTQLATNHANKHMQVPIHM